jgi:uncharacterized protein (TIGR03118 family)
VEQLEDRRLLSARFLQTNLVSDIQGLAANFDPNLINPFGLTASPSTPGHPGSPFWVSDNNADVSTLYNGAGQPQFPPTPLVVQIPGASKGTAGMPTGIVFDTDPNGADFNVSNGKKSGHSVFLFDTIDGTIDGWAPGVDFTHAFVGVTGPKGALYTGLAIDTNGSNTLLYAADWGTGKIEAYDSNFKPVQLMKVAFTDPNIPKDFRPFNVQDINGNIFVTYAQFDPKTGVDMGTGGFVDEYSRDGVLMLHIGSGGKLNSPWGVALAPLGFGKFGGDLLVGNFGDGRIHAYDPNNGNFLGTLRDANGRPISIENLWALRFGNDGNAGSSTTLFFTAGLVDAPATPFGASAGLLGSLQAIPSISKHAAIIPHLGDPFPQGPAFQQFSTVPANGDQNPYGVAFVPPGFPTGGKGMLQPGDILVSNFNNAGTPPTGNFQGTGTTIVRIGPAGQESVFFQATKEQGLTTALGVLKSGFVIVGDVPTTDGTFNTIQQGSLLVLNKDGQVVLTLQSKKLLNGPWDLAVNDRGNHVQLFVANVLSGTITRIDAQVNNGKFQVNHMTQIASGFKHEPNGPALVVGPTGLAFDPARNELFVASTDDNKIFVIPHAGTTSADHGTGKVVFDDQSILHGPLGLVLAPNGDLITANGDAVNTDPNQPSELVEINPNAPAGTRFVGEFSVDPGTGGAFGVAVSDVGRVLRLAAVDDNANALDVWTFESR